MKSLLLIFVVFFALVSITLAKPPFIEHGKGLFERSILLTSCLAKGKKTFRNLGITVKKTTNPKNEVVGFQGNYKIVLYCVSEEGGCDEPEDVYASGGTVIVAGEKYEPTAQWVKKILKKMKLK
ncbi:MAG: hypothetical protein KAG28_10520 [Cocleimonas sp.]|nr:hypothetical protein [Cocleimonas sp.]